MKALLSLIAVLTLASTAYAADDEYGGTLIGQRVENHGNGFCDLYRTFRYPNGRVIEKWVAWYACPSGH